MQKHICEKCGIEFTKIIKNGRKKRCDSCKLKRVHSKINLSNLKLTDCSSRTISKIFKRADIGCALCGWKESTCDIHHIVHQRNGGTDDLNNLIYVCPNHHRIIHSNKSIDVSEFKGKTLDLVLPNWKDFYSIKSGPK